MNLTGIKQSQVDAAQTLEPVLVAFADWLRRCIAEHKLRLPKLNVTQAPFNTSFVTWSDWDFGTCLQGECERKRLLDKRPPVCDQWCDLRHHYRLWYANGAKDFVDAMRLVGMQFEGRPHSGLADARNEARLACNMWHAGVPLKVTKDLRPHIIDNWV